MNETVQKRNMEVKDLRTDLEDGIKLINFFEVLSDRRLTSKWDTKPVQRIQKMNNIFLALRFMERDMGVRNPGCSAEDIIDANTRGIKLILGLLYTLYRKYRMQVSGSSTRKGAREEDQLLEWTRQVLRDAGYEELASTVQSFRTSFNDGRVYLTLAHIYDGDENTFDYEEALAKAPVDVLDTAFDFAEKKMSVSRLLDAAEVADGGMDERAMALYSSLFYHAFKTKAELAQMQDALGANELELQLNAKGKAELVKLNCELTEQLNALTAKHEELEAKEARTHDELLEARDRIAELEKMLAARDAEIAELHQRLTDLETANAAEQLKKQMAEQELSSLQQQLDATHELCEQEKDSREKAEKDLAALQAELEKTRERLALETTAKEGGVRELTDKLTTETTARKELEERKVELEKHEEELEAEVSDLKRRLKKEQKAKANRDKDVDDLLDQTRTNASGLGVLRANLDAHISDLHRWQKFLDGAASEIPDPVEEIERLNADLENLDFKAQLELISGTLKDENIAMTKILTEREAEKEKSGAGAKKTRRRGKK